MLCLFEGTYVAIDIGIHLLDNKQTVDLKRIVTQIRAQRAYSVQMPEQYLFCYLALYEYVISAGKVPNVINARALLFDKK